MKVLHVIGGIAWRYGGTTAVVLTLCEALARKPGMAVEIAATDADGPGGRLNPDTTPRTSIPLHLFQRRCSERWKFSLDLFRWLWRRAGEYDLIHLHGLWSFATAAAGWAARRRRAPYVVSPHGMLSPYGWSRSPWTKRLYWRLLERRTLARAARLMVTAAGEREEVASLDLPTPLVTIPLGLGPDAWETPARPSRLRELCQGRDRGRPLVLYLSRLHPKKGLAEFLLPAFQALLHDAFLVVAGGPDSGTAVGYAEQAQATVNRLELADRVMFLGPINPDDRWSLFDGADVFVLPSLSENFGLVVTEAMARGCPVVVSSGAFACEHVAAAGAGTVIPLKVDELTASLDALLSDPDRRAEMGRRGREYAPKLHWDRIADAIVEMYRDCLASGGQSRRPSSSP